VYFVYYTAVCFIFLVCLLCVYCLSVGLHLCEINYILLWPLYVIGQAIIFLPCGFFLLLSSFSIFSSPNLSGRRLDVYHTSKHGVALVRI